MVRDESPVCSAELRGAHVLSFPRRDLLDLDCVQLAREHISDLMKSEPAPRIVLDLANVMLLTSDGIALIVSLRNALRPRGVEIHIANVSREARVVFDHLRLNRLVKIFETTEQAIAAFG